MEKKTNHYVEDRLMHLFRIKQGVIGTYEKAKKLSKAQRVDKQNLIKSDFKTNTIFSVVKSKEAEILAASPEFDYIPLSNDGVNKVNVLKKIWEYEWMISNTDLEFSKVVKSALDFGDGFMYEGIRKIKREINEPYMSKGALKFKKKMVTEYDGIYCEYIPWGNVYFDGLTIDKSNECAWIKDWNRDDFFNKHRNNKLYKNISEEDIPIGRHYYYTSNNNKEYILSLGGNTDEIVTTLTYYNKSKDEMIVLANGIEIRKGPIPYAHKEIPILKFEDYPLLDRFYSMGEYELLNEDERFKDAVRSLKIDVIKAQMGVTVIAPDADFDEANIELGIGNVTRVDPKEISFFSPSINSNILQNAEAEIDNDIIIKSGIDFRAQSLNPGETATRTSSKQQSARKRINLMLRLNSFNFFSRLARLRMANIQLLYGEKNRVIPIKGGEIDENGVLTPLAGGYGTFTVKPQYVIGKFNIIPITDSLLGNSTEKKKLIMLEFMGTAGNMVDDKGKPVFNIRKLGEKLSEVFGLDYQELTGMSEEFKSPDDILDQIKKREQGISSSTTDINSPEFIPPEQRSGNRLNVQNRGGGLSANILENG